MGLTKESKVCVIAGLVGLCSYGSAKEVSSSNIGERYQALETLAKGLFYLETLYVEPEKVRQEDLVSHALNGIVGKLDPHTVLMPDRAFEQLTNDTQGKFGGIGIIVSLERGRLIVISPIEGTPAAKAGIKSNDEIVAIDGISVSTLKNKAAEKMRGKPESEIKISIRRKGIDDILHFDLVRKVIKTKSVRIQDLSNGVFLARIASFQDSTTDDLLGFLKKQGQTMKGLVLDLRDNPGGLLDQAVQVTDLFIESGVIVSTVGRDPGNIEREFAHKRGTYSGFPMIVLINGGSASASEIVAGALQDHERALVLGTTSFGKGSVQTLISLPNRSGLKITVARYFTPKDRSIQAKGIAPDIMVMQNKEGDSGNPGGTQRQKEVDLKGHIESGDLSDLGNTPGIQGSMENWPSPLRKDHQLVTAYTYLRGWSLFGKKPSPANQKASQQK